MMDLCKHGHDTEVCGRTVAAACIECGRQATARWRRANPETLRVSARRRRRDNPKNSRAAVKKWKQTHPKAYRTMKARQSANRRALKRKAQCGCPKRLAAIYVRCRELRQWFDVVVDHIIPLSKGGAHSSENLQIIYAYENVRKGAQLDYVPSVVFS